MLANKLRKKKKKSWAYRAARGSLAGRLTGFGDKDGKSRGGRELSAEENLRAMYAQQLRDYELYQQPVLDALEKEAESTDLIDRAQDRAAGIEDRVREITDRQLGTSSNTLLPAQKRMLERKIKRDSTMSAGSMITGARDAQKVRRVAARNQLMSIAEQLQQTGVANTADAASKLRARKEAAKKARGQLFGQVLGTAGAVIGGMVGGPMGAQVGASIGSAVGGYAGGG